MKNRLSRLLAAALFAAALVLFGSDLFARSCPSGYSRQGSHCVRTSCPSGTWLDGSRCVRCPRSNCTYVGGGKCRCPRR
jgi:hypothetical protein